MTNNASSVVCVKKKIIHYISKGYMEEFSILAILYVIILNNILKILT